MYLDDKNNDVQAVGFWPIVIGAAALLGATGIGGYMMGRPSTDAAGKPIPGPIDRAVDTVSGGVSKAIQYSAIAVVAYLLYQDYVKKRKA